MLRVVLVIDDYNELIYLETVLKKLGFDVEGLQNPRKYFDVSLGFNPHIVMLSARGKKVDGLQLAQGIQRRRGFPKVVALVPVDQRLTPDEIEAAEIDQVLDSPINPRKLILALATTGDLDEQALIDKYQKIKGMAPLDTPSSLVMYDDNGQPTQTIKSIRSELEALDPIRDKNAAPEAEPPVPVRSTVLLQMPSEEQIQLRKQRHETWLKKMGVAVTGAHFRRDRIHEFNRHIRSAPQPEDIVEIEDERKRYVKALFEKPKN